MTPDPAEVDRPRFADAMTLQTDSRADPRMVRALAEFGLDGRAEAPAITPDSPREDQLALLAGAEVGFTAVYEALFDELPALEGVTRDTIVVRSPEGHDIRLHIHRPTESQGLHPAVYQIHGGGMTIMAADGSSYSRLRDELAATGLIVIGVEFRNGAGAGGPNPYPAGLDDCRVGMRWVASHLDELGASHVVITGDSGGANLALALAIAAKREGWVHEIAGVYAQCPFIYGFWAEQPPELPSLTQSNGYFMNVDLLQIMSSVYDPGAAHRNDPLCWPSRATVEDLEGLPPHVISINELDPMRDEGQAFFRKLLTAGVAVQGRTNLGLCHTAETMFRRAMPDLYSTHVHAIRDFAHSVTPISSALG